MDSKPHHTATYRIIQDSGGIRFRFFCEASGAALCTSRPAAGRPIDEMLRQAWETEGREFFNLCHRCGRWVSNVMYNADTLECVDCSPWEEQPAFCPQCGARVGLDDIFCPGCKVRLLYGWSDEDGKACGASP